MLAGTYGDFPPRIMRFPRALSSSRVGVRIKQRRVPPVSFQSMMIVRRSRRCSNRALPNRALSVSRFAHHITLYRPPSTPLLTACIPSSHQPRALPPPAASSFNRLIYAHAHVPNFTPHPSLLRSRLSPVLPSVVLACFSSYGSSYPICPIHPAGPQVSRHAFNQLYTRGVCGCPFSFLVADGQR